MAKSSIQNTRLPIGLLPELEEETKSEKSSAGNSPNSVTSVKNKLVVLQPVITMTELDPSSIKLVMEKLDVDNLTSWQWGIVTMLGYKKLNDYVLAKHTADMKSSPNYRQKKKQVTNFIWMHISHSNLECFVPDLTEYDPKSLWDSIVTHFVAKTVEKSANALDRLFDTQFIKGKMEKSVNTFQALFWRVVEVSSKFNKKSL